MDSYIEYLLYQAASSANILAVTSVCNVGCIFCSHAQNPREVAVYRIPHLPLETIKGIIPYLSADKKIVIGESVTKVYEGEPFSHPQFFEILSLLRKKFLSTVIQITTNGSYLTEQTINKLAEFHPIELNLSLNSADIENRVKLMQDKSADIAAHSPRLLSAYGIPYHGSIVAMPHIVGWSDIFNTCRYLNKHQVQTIRLFVPGFTRFTPAQFQFNVDNMTGEFSNVVKRLRNELQIPVLFEPHMPDNLLAVIEGVIIGSAAAKAGIKSGDIIDAVNGQAVYSRVDAFTRLLGCGKKQIALIREGKSFNALLALQKDERPGIVMYHDIDFDLVKKIRATITRKKCKLCIILVSELAFELWQGVFASEDSVTVHMVPSYLFGGSIKAAGLLTVDDYQKALDKLAANGLQPDLIFVPQISFDPAGKDLTGVSYLELSVGSAELVML